MSTNPKKEALPDKPPVRPTPADCLNVGELYGVYRNYLNHEHNLINQRLGWNFTIQGFLFTSYAFVSNKIADVRIELAKEAVGSVALLRSAQYDLQLLLLVVAAAGLCTSVAVHFSTWAARMAADELRKRWSKLIYEEGQTLEDLSLSRGYPQIMGGGHPDAVKAGFYAPAILSFAFALAWLFLIVHQLFFGY